MSHMFQAAYQLRKDAKLEPLAERTEGGVRKGITCSSSDQDALWLRRHSEVVFVRTQQYLRQLLLCCVRVDR